MTAVPQDDHTSADYYADSYSHFGIHEEMLKDTVRTRTYMNSILQNSHLFSGKAVLDVGCGTGILSMFAARAGARKVYAVDMSSIADQAKLIVMGNGFEGVITVIRGKMEDLDLPEKVDIIVSEWMGYALYYESMLPTVLLARDRWLAPGGKLLPDRAEVFVAAIEDADYKQEKIHFWNNVYGFNMEPIKEIALQEPLVDTVTADLVNSSVAKVAMFNLNTMHAHDIPFDAEVHLKVQRDDYIHALVLWFDIYFDACHTQLMFSTSPANKPTHWKQTVFYLKDALTVCKGEVLDGRIKCIPNAKNPRDLDFELTYSFQGRHSQSSDTLSYRMR